MTECRQEPDSVDFVTQAVWALTIVVSVVLAYATTGSSSALIFTAGFVALVVLRPSIRFIRRARFRWHQRARDTLAAEIAASADEGFLLYLRPFNSTGNLSILLSYVERWYKSPASSRPQTWAEKDQIDLETELARALEPFGNLVGLGQPGEHSGAGRTAVGEADWQRVFSSLAERAGAIFIVPATTDGTMWELDQLLARPDWARKSYFVVPPSLGPLVFGYGIAVGGHAQDALQALRQRGFELEPTNEGRLLKLDEDGRLVGAKLLEYAEPTSGSSHRNKLVAKHGVRAAILKVAPHLAEQTNDPPMRRIQVHETVGQNVADSIASFVDGLLQRDLGPPYAWRIPVAALGIVAIMVGSFLPPPSTVRELPDALVLAGIGLILIASAPRLGAAFVSINLLLVFSRQLPVGLLVVLALAYFVLAMLLMFILGMITLMLLGAGWLSLGTWKRKRTAKSRSG